MSTDASVTRRGLGRGLEVLIGGASQPELLHLPTETIHPNPRQPRRRFEPEATSGLAASIRLQGVLQPVVVRPRPEGGYQLVAGERRVRAALERVELLKWHKGKLVIERQSKLSSVPVREPKSPADLEAIVTKALI